ncbi:MAG: hypothetical protein HYR60_01115 [Acidobacteria bacterium]|nr:hypothetical protein [Acidobacteriota bacterium]
MRVLRRAGALSLLVFLFQPVSPLPGQTADEEIFDVYTEHPRLFLGTQRLRLLRRERERRSMRWVQFETLMAGKAPMPEPGFAAALFYQASGEPEYGKQAIQWALKPASRDTRQLALVFDWCQPLLSEPDSRVLAAKLEKALEAPHAADAASVRSRALAALALAGHNRKVSTRQMEWTVRDWWRGRVVPALKIGDGRALARDDSYALLELLHAVRDNLNIDLREPVPGFFKDLPIYHLLSYYPPAYAASDNEYRIPSIRNMKGEPDTLRAMMSRAAELAMVAYDVNDPGSQVLQGWLMHDRFLLRGTSGVPYEFLWANPYNPGLSYYHVPLIFHDDRFGRLFIRSAWDDAAAWFGYFDGQVQWFEDGRPTVITPQLSTAPLAMPDAVVLFGEYARKFTLTLQENEVVFVVGLEPRQAYEVEVDDEEMYELISDPGGILQLKLPHKVPAGVRMRPAKPRKH